MKKWIKRIYLKYEDIILYLFWGAMAFGLNIVLYEVFVNFFGMHYMVANGLDWFLCVVFAYTTNRICVFKSQVKDVKGILGEAMKFFSCRVVSGVMDMAFMVFTVSVLSMNDSVAKIITQVIVIVSNYIFSKLFVFHNKE